MTHRMESQPSLRIERRSLNPDHLSLRHRRNQSSVADARQAEPRGLDRVALLRRAHRPQSSQTIGALDRYSTRQFSSFQADQCFPDAVTVPINLQPSRSEMSRQVRAQSAKLIRQKEKEDEIVHHEEFEKKLSSLQQTPSPCLRAPSVLSCGSFDRPSTAASIPVSRPCTAMSISESEARYVVPVLRYDPPLSILPAAFKRPQSSLPGRSKNESKSTTPQTAQLEAAPRPATAAQSRRVLRGPTQWRLKDPIGKKQNSKDSDAAVLSATAQECISLLNCQTQDLQRHRSPSPSVMLASHSHRTSATIADSGSTTMNKLLRFGSGSGLSNSTSGCGEYRGEELAARPLRAFAM